MEDFWRIISGWSPLGQGIFFLIVIGSVIALIKHLGYYLVVAARGWPPAHAPSGLEDDDTEEHEPV